MLFRTRIALDLVPLSARVVELCPCEQARGAHPNPPLTHKWAATSKDARWASQELADIFSGNRLRKTQNAVSKTSPWAACIGQPASHARRRRDESVMWR